MRDPGNEVANGDAHITVTPVLSVHKACVAGAKREGVGEEGEETRPSQFPFPQSPTPLDACFAVWSPYTVETRYEEELRAQGLAKFVRNNEVSFYRSALSYIFILLLGQRKLFLIPETWLYRGSLQYRGSTVWRCLGGTNSRSQIYTCVRWRVDYISKTFYNVVSVQR